ncbi:MAG: FHA domain-containing protein, partial [Limisphaerales bacterium]
MLRLVVNPDTPDAWSVDVQPGVLSLGRGDANNLPIDHASVSSEHCRLEVGEKGVTLQDLGSTAGTFIDGELVERANVKPGQLIRLGEVVLRFESDLPAENSGPPRAPRLPTQMNTPPVSLPAFCKFHPRVAARFACPKCRISFCELCVS